MLKNKSFLITGGTGSFGNTLAKKLVSTDVAEVVIFSRDEAKQHFMKQEIRDSRVRYILGDVRDEVSVQKALSGVDFVFHAAALKQVPASESFPWEFVKTNIQGSHNLLNGFAQSKVTNAVFLSTDKAVYPLNAMGMTKAMMEKLVRSDDYPSTTTSVVTRYGNVIGSRGSVIPQFIETIKMTNQVSVTDLGMTRFMMSLDESVDLVLFALANGDKGDLFVQKSPAASVDTIVQALSILMNRNNVSINVIGIRPGEKTHETLLTSEERSLAIEHDRYFQVKKRVGNELGFNHSTKPKDEYTSENTETLDPEQLAIMLMEIPYIKSSLER